MFGEMRKRIPIILDKIVDEQLFLYIDQSILDLMPTGQMLVDSDQISFIYLLEGQEDYTYIVLPEQIWSTLKTAIDHHYPVYIVFNEEKVELTNFHEELGYLISNLHGNGNYGEEMERKAELYFS